MVVVRAGAALSLVAAFAIQALLARGAIHAQTGTSDPTADHALTVNQPVVLVMMAQLVLAHASYSISTKLKICYQSLRADAIVRMVSVPVRPAAYARRVGQQPQMEHCVAAV